MPRQSASSIENNFVGGLKTEFSGLNFPENACTETFNCKFDRIGRVTRRRGIDYEQNFDTETIDRDLVAVKDYLWKNVAGDGNTNLLVLQVGSTLYFYNASAGTSAAPLSGQKLATTITLTTYSASGAPTPESTECEFADGNGYLFVFHPHLQPFYVTYNTSTATATGTSIDVQIRDFEGVNDSLEIDERPSTLSVSHRYNLANQGWTSPIIGTSTTSITIGTGSKGPFTTQSTLGLRVGDRVRIYSDAGATYATNGMLATVTAYSGTSLTVNVTAVNGAGTFTDWIIELQPPNITGWFEAVNNYPSNCDVWWQYKNSSDDFAPATTFDRVPQSNTPAPKGHFILSAWDQQRDAVSGIATITDVTTSGARPSVGAFFQGRVWYGGVNYAGYNGKLYFSQIIQGTADFAKCYQQNDPTSEDLFDLLPSDGGVISIQGAGTVIKLFAMRSALVVFATNGIWAITGSQGLGFTANDYTITKLESIRSLTSSSFVDVNGTPFFWNSEGIYSVLMAEGRLQVKSLTEDTIDSFYQDIPSQAKRYARGAFNPNTFHIQWCYRSTSGSTLTEYYEFDRILNFNTLTGAFYPWSLDSDNTSKVHGVFVLDSTGGTTTVNQVTSNSGADTVQDGSGNNVVTFGTSSSTVSEPVFKYITSKTDGAGSYTWTFSEEWRTTYVDFGSATSSAMESYFITGYKVHGDAQRKFQPNYVYVYCDNTEATVYNIQGLWNFANTGASGQWSSRQRVTTPQATDLDGLNFDYVYRRHKIRGHGVACQFKIVSSAGYPFSVVGWSVWETSNARP